MFLHILRTSLLISTPFTFTVREQSLQVRRKGADPESASVDESLETHDPNGIGNHGAQRALEGAG